MNKERSTTESPAGSTVPHPPHPATPGIASHGMTPFGIQHIGVDDIDGRPIHIGDRVEAFETDETGSPVGGPVFHGLVIWDPESLSVEIESIHEFSGGEMSGSIKMGDCKHLRFRVMNPVPELHTANPYSEGGFGPNDRGYLCFTIRSAAKTLVEASELWSEGHYPHSNARVMPWDNQIAIALSALSDLDSNIAVYANLAHDPRLFLPYVPSIEAQTRWDRTGGESGPCDSHGVEAPRPQNSSVCRNDRLKKAVDDLGENMMLEWVEPRVGISPDGSRVDVCVTHRASAANCIAMAKAAREEVASRNGEPKEDEPGYSDFDALLDFISVHWAIVDEEILRDEVLFPDPNEWKPDYDLNPRRVVCAANRHRMTGLVVAGARHMDKVMRAQMQAAYPRIRWKGHSESGFIDQFGDFMTREEAWEVASARGQIIRRCGGDGEDLYSENLY